MENSEKTNKTITATLSDAELATLLGLAGVNTEKTSPLSAVAGIPCSRDKEVAASLQQLGFLEPATQDRLTPECFAALNILANPDVEIRMVWGNADKVNFSDLYATATAGSDAMVAFTRNTQGENNVSYLISHQDITALVRDRIAFTEIKDPLPLSYVTDANTLPIFFAVLDLYEEAVLKAALARTQELAIDLSVEAVNRVLLDAKTNPALGWYSSLGYLLMSQALPDATTIKTGLQGLQREGVIITGNDSTGLGSNLATFAFRAFPILNYFGATVSTGKGSEFGGAQFGLIMSLNTLLFVQRIADNSGERFSINSIGTSEVPEILFELATLPFEAPVSPEVPSPEAKKVEGIACAKCGALNAAGTKFCAKCGASLAAPAIKFCPKCGDPVKVGEKFCEKCGNRLG